MSSKRTLEAMMALGLFSAARRADRVKRELMYPGLSCSEEKVEIILQDPWQAMARHLMSRTEEHS